MAQTSVGGVNPKEFGSLDGSTQRRGIQIEGVWKFRWLHPALH